MISVQLTSNYSSYRISLIFTRDGDNYRDSSRDNQGNGDTRATKATEKQTIETMEK